MSLEVRFASDPHDRYGLLRSLVLVLVVAGAGACSAPRVRVPSPDPLRLLPAPPDVDSSATREELDRILEIQTTRTPEREAQARADVELSVFRLLPGAEDEGLRAADLSSLVSLSDRLRDQVLKSIEPVKEAFGRPRPFVLEPRIHPCVPSPTTPSYPSGHAAFAAASARVLITAAPEREEGIARRARAYAWSRVVCGVHYPSDVAAGELLGRTIAARLLASPAFLRTLDAARCDLRAALGLGPPIDLRDQSALRTLGDRGAHRVAALALEGAW
jgi:acid phosphatase (class A)